MEPEPTAKRLTVLLVEDSPAVAKQIRGFLATAKSPRFFVQHVADLSTALQVVARGEVDVVLLDLGLPDSLGLDTFVRMHRRAPRVAKVVFTSLGDEQMALEAVRRGAQDYLMKGEVDAKTLVRAIRYAVERKRTEEKLRESEEKHRTLLEILPEIVYRVDPEGYITYVNPSVRSLGYEPEELIGSHFSSVVHPEDLPNVSRRMVLPKFSGQQTGHLGSPKLLDERRSGDRMTRDLTLRLVPKGWTEDQDADDSGFVIGLLTSFGEVTAAGHYDTDEQTSVKRFIGTVGIIKDITERTRAEQEKAALQDQLQQAQKMEAIGRLAGGVAHDMNNLLGAILGSASVLDVEMPASDPNREDLENILTACRKGRDLTRDLLGFARKGKYFKESISLNEIAEEAKSLLSRTITKKIRVVLRLEDKLDHIEGDRSQIHHALMNVCINAADAMKDQGTLTISTRNAFPDENRCMALGLEPGPFVEMKVSDTGLGMDEETLKNVFEPFFTTKPKGEGTGLGLSMVYGVLKNHGGAVTIKSEPNRGTVVTFLLPTIDEVEQPATTRRRIRPSSTPKAGAVLVVDDEQTIRVSARRLLEKLGYTALLADNGEMGVDLYERKKDSICLVLLDLVMPEKDGHETFEALLALDPEVKVLLLSGYSKDEKVKRILESGATGFLQKPFDLETLSDAVKRALATD